MDLINLDYLLRPVVYIYNIEENLIVTMVKELMLTRSRCLVVHLTYRKGNLDANLFS